MGITYIDPIAYANPHQVGNFFSIALDREIFYPGEQVTGEVWVLSPSDIYLYNILLKLEKHEKWTFVESSDRLEFDNIIITLHEQGLIEQNNNQVTQQMLNLKGQTKFQFKFSFTLPKDLLPSFEYPFSNRTAFIRYQLMASLVSPNQYPLSNSYIIIKSRPLILSEPLNLSSCVNVHSWGVMENGTTIMSISFPTNNYRYLDVIPVKVTINNLRSELETKLIKLELLREISFIRQGGIQKYNFSKSIKTQEYPFVCPFHSIKTDNISIQFKDNEEAFSPLVIPYPSFHDKKGMFIGSVDSSLIKCKYYIKATCYFTTMVGHENRPRVIAPLSITYQLNDEFQLEKKENEDVKLALFESQIEFENIKANKKEDLIDEAVENDDNGGSKEKDQPMQMSVINNVYQGKNIFPMGNHNQQGNYQPAQNKQNVPVDQKPADFVDINAL